MMAGTADNRDDNKQGRFNGCQCDSSAAVTTGKGERNGRFFSAAVTICLSMPRCGNGNHLSVFGGIFNPIIVSIMILIYNPAASGSS